MTVFRTFPTTHWRQIWSTNPLERVNKEIKRSTDVVRVFPDPAALLRLASAVLVEQHDEWDAADRRYFSGNSMKQLDATIDPLAIPGITAAESEPLTEPPSENSTTRRDATSSPSSHLANSLWTVRRLSSGPRARADPGADGV